MKNHRSVKQLARRDVLAGFGAVTAGMGFVNQAIADENNPAARVADRAPSIRISGMKTYRVGPVLCVKIETSHGVKNLRGAQESGGVH